MKNFRDELVMPNPATEIQVSEQDLPLHCPMDKSSGWASHPRVFLPIEQQKNSSYACPYCGTKYIFS